jgi:uncharacterized protein YybS (DUF2232 family)
MVEGGIITSIIIVFAILGAYLPIVGSVFVLLFPLPVVVLGVRHGHKWGIMATIAAGFFIAILLSPLQAMKFVIIFGLLGIVMGYGFRQNYRAIKTFALSTITSFFSIIVSFGLLLALTGINIVDVQLRLVETTMSEIIEFYRGLGVSEEELTKLADSAHQLEFVKFLLPSAWMIAAAMLNYVNFQMGKIVLKKLGHSNIPAFPPFKTWNMPRETIYFLVAGLVMIYWGSTRNLDVLRGFGANLELITTFMLTIQGMAVTSFLAGKYNLSRFMFGAIILILILTGFFMKLLFFVGALDLVFDFRKLRKPESQPQGK